MQNPAAVGSTDLQRTILGLFGDRGAAWLDELPDLVARLEARWSCTSLPPFANLSYNYVAPVTDSAGIPLVLKLGVPKPELFSEMEALHHYDGRGCARLVACDREQGAILLERLVPGTPLSELSAEDDEAATLVAAEVMSELWRPVPQQHGFPSVARWGAGLRRLRARFGGGTGPLPRGLVEQAEELFTELLASMDKPVLLHGDLHHENILAAGAGVWKAVDPKGVIGEPAYEIGALLRNPFPSVLSRARPDRIMARRLDQLSVELGFDRQRLLDWSLAQAVLSAWWCLEDNVPCWEDMIACAELLASL